MFRRSISAESSNTPPPPPAAGRPRVRYNPLMSPVLGACLTFRNYDQDKSYACTLCSKAFLTSQALGGHQNVHRQERNELRLQFFQDNGCCGGPVENDKNKNKSPVVESDPVQDSDSVVDPDPSRWAPPATNDVQDSNSILDPDPLRWAPPPATNDVQDSESVLDPDRDPLSWISPATNDDGGNRHDYHHHHQDVHHRDDFHRNDYDQGGGSQNNNTVGHEFINFMPMAADDIPVTFDPKGLELGIGMPGTCWDTPLYEDGEASGSNKGKKYPKLDLALATEADESADDDDDDDDNDGGYDDDGYETDDDEYDDEEDMVDGGGEDGTNDGELELALQL